MAKTEADEKEFQNARRYDGGRQPTARSRPTKSSGGFGDAIASVVIKELKGTTGRRIVRGIFGTLFKAR